MRGLGHTIGGVYCPEIRDENKRTGFRIIDIATGRDGLLAGVNTSGPTVGKYHVNLDDLEELGVSALKNALKMADYIFIDEIAPMELMSTSFSQCCLAGSGKPKTSSCCYTLAIQTSIYLQS